jgi:phage virion morphogenesis protein
MTVHLAIDLRDDIGPELRRIAMRTGTVTQVLDEIGAALEASTQQRFLDERDPAGEKWRRLSDATVRRRGSAHPILRQSADLFDSIGRKVQGARLLVGVNRTYGRIQHLGGRAGRGRKVYIPPRLFLGLSRSDLWSIADIVTDHLEAT